MPPPSQCLDPRTRLILFKLINGGVCVSINGCVSTGKEANVYHAHVCVSPLAGLTPPFPSGDQGGRIHRVSRVLVRRPLFLSLTVRRSPSLLPPPPPLAVRRGCTGRTSPSRCTRPPSSSSRTATNMSPVRRPPHPRPSARPSTHTPIAGGTTPSGFTGRGPSLWVLDANASSGVEMLDFQCKVRVTHVVCVCVIRRVYLSSCACLQGSTGSGRGTASPTHGRWCGRGPRRSAATSSASPTPVPPRQPHRGTFLPPQRAPVGRLMG